MPGTNSNSTLEGRFDDDPQKETTTQDDGTQSAPQPSSETPKETTQPYVSNYAELEDYIRGQMADAKPETPEERKKRERREKWEGIISGISDMGMALSNLFFTSQYAPNMYNGKESLSKKAQERMEKAKAAREKNGDRYMNYALTLGKLKDADRDYQNKMEQQRQAQANWKAQFDAGRADRKADEDYRQGRAKAADDQWQKQFDYNKDRDERNFNEQVRQFNVSSSLQRQSLSMQAQRLQMERENNSQIYTLGEGNGSVTVPKAAINSHNFAAVYNSLPKGYRTAKGEPSAEAMAIAVGAYLGDQSVPADQKTATRTALSQIGKKSGGNSRTMPGVN